jgi:chemotaxis family two-component system sensor kinase Cph1
MQELLTEALEMLGARVAESGVEIRIPRPLPPMWGDRVRIREVFANLVSNGIKYNDRPDRWVEVGYIEPDEPAPAFFDPAAAAEDIRGSRVLYVRDNGIGISPRHFEQVFGLFKRLHPRDAYGGGSGAGLTIAKRLVEQHGGRIWLQSRPGEGTTFFFTLASAGSPAKDPGES